MASRPSNNVMTWLLGARCAPDGANAMTIKPGSRQTDRNASAFTDPPDESLQAIEPSALALSRTGQASVEPADKLRTLKPHRPAAATNNAPASGHRSASLPCMTKLGPARSETPDSSKPVAGMTLEISVNAAARAERLTSI
jgi:hypothetical protein